MPSRGPMSGVTIVDLSRVLAGPYCTMLLAEQGARVIKVEAPGKGDDAREYGPFVKDKSIYFMSVNRGKESIALDLTTAGDRAILEKMLARADVVVENYRPGTMEKFGLGWDVLHAKFPKLIYASASGFGHSGPDKLRPAYDIVVQGMGGIMSVTGHAGGPPTRVGMSIGDIGAGLYTCIGVQSALFHRAMTGEATKVDISMFDCQLALLENAALRYFLTGTAPGPLGVRHQSITPFEVYDAADGYIVIAAGNDSLFVKLCNALGRPDLAKDARYLTNPLRHKSVDALKVDLEHTLKTDSVAHWLALLDKAGVPSGPINNIGQAVDSPQAQARNMVVTVDDPDAGKVRLVGNPIKISGFDDPSTRQAAPTLDGDRAKILREIGAA